MAHSPNTGWTVSAEQRIAAHKHQLGRLRFGMREPERHDVRPLHEDGM
jgi:hypothetical protein